MTPCAEGGGTTLSRPHLIMGMGRRLLGVVACVAVNERGTRVGARLPTTSGGPRLGGSNPPTGATQWMSCLAAKPRRRESAGPSPILLGSAGSWQKTLTHDKALTPFGGVESGRLPSTLGSQSALPCSSGSEGGGEGSRIGRPAGWVGTSDAQAEGQHARGGRPFRAGVNASGPGSAASKAFRPPSLGGLRPLPRLREMGCRIDDPPLP